MIARVVFFLALVSVASASVTIYNGAGFGVDYYVNSILYHQDPGQTITLQTASDGYWLYYTAANGVYDGHAADGTAFTFTGSAVVAGGAPPPPPPSDESQAFAAGFGLMAMVRIFRAGLKWFRRAGTERDTG